MTEEPKKAGLGEVIYSTDPAKPKTPDEKKAASREVEEADIESFPASDPPGFGTGTSTKDND